VALKEELVKTIKDIDGIGASIARRVVSGQEIAVEVDAQGAAVLNELDGDGKLSARRVNEGAIEPRVSPLDVLLNNHNTPVINKEIKMEDIAIPAPVAPAPVAPAPTLDLGAALAGLVMGQVEARIQGAVDAAVAAKIPREIKIKVADAPAVKVEGHAHPMFEKVLKLVAAKQNVLLVGPAGCGKTHLFSMVAKALGKRHASISLSAGVTEAHLTGRLLPTGDGGRFVYTQSPFVTMYTEGGAFLLDEMDGADPNVLLCTQQATANGGFEIEARGASGLDTYVARHPDAVIMATANTFGTGAGALYVGRNQLDAATLDRWYVVQMDYDKSYEERLAPSQVTHFVWTLRDLITENRWRRVASTRMIQKAGAALAAGLDWKTVKEDLLAGYSADERAKIKF
jgi:cobaltochelatase CobS